MARNETLGVVLSRVKAETQRVLTPANTNDDPQICQVIADIQQWLGSEFDWPFLQNRWDVSVPAGTRYLAYPTTDDVGGSFAINFERMGSFRAFVKWNNVWQDVEYGIRELEEYNYIDSDEGQVLDPIQRWAMDDENNFEVWPIPASTATIRFIGQRVLTELRTAPLTQVPPVWNLSATLDLDGLMVGLYAAAEYLIRKNETAIGQILMAKAAARMKLIQLTYPKIDKPCVIGGSSAFDRRALRIVPMVVVGRH